MEISNLDSPEDVVSVVQPRLFFIVLFIGRIHVCLYILYPLDLSIVWLCLNAHYIIFFHIYKGLLSNVCKSYAWHFKVSR